MRSIYLFLFLFLCSACSDFDNKEVLDRELSDVSILSVSFDSLLSEVRKMPSRDRVACIINVSRRNEKEIDGVKKQERLLMEILPISYGKKRKEVLLHLVTICSNLDRFGIPCAELRGLKWIELLEKNHSLSQEEEWQVSEIKALLYNPQIQISAESETKRSIFREKDKTKRSKKESAQHSKSRNKSFVMTSVSAL